MKFNELRPNTSKRATRVGRGIAAGKGKTAGRGTKGQKSRTGKGRRPGFEGGQNPLMQRLPKLPGFRSIRPKNQLVYTGQLNQLRSSVVDNFSLAKSGITTSPYVAVKLVVKGEVNKKVQVKLQKASSGAVAAVQQAGGSFESVERVARPPSSKSKDE